MQTFNDIGISSQLDWKRIRKLFIIGLIAGCMVFVGDMLLGYGVYDDDREGKHDKFCQARCPSMPYHAPPHEPDTDKNTGS